jgi:hypothetical protein
MEVQEFASLSAYDNFVYALKAKETKRQYPHRLDKFLSFIGLQGTIPNKCQKLCEIKDVKLLESHLIRFINFQKERIENKEAAISVQTKLSPYAKFKMALKSKEVQRQYPNLLGRFFD